MALTTNYSWDKPTVLGDVGAWGTKLNTIFDSIDTQVKTNETASAAADAKALVAQVDILEMANAAIDASAACSSLGGTAGMFSQGEGAIGISLSSGAGSGTILIPLPQLPVGLRITALKAQALSQDANGSVNVQIRKRANGSTASTTVKQLLISNAVEGTYTSTAVAEDIVADTAYYFWVSFTRTSGAGIHLLRTVQLVCTRP